jgi:hypothetical protein
MISPSLSYPWLASWNIFFLLCRFFTIRKGALEGSQAFAWVFGTFIFERFERKRTAFLQDRSLFLFVTGYAMLC